MSNQDFINKIVKGAQAGYKKYGVFPSVTIAQACLESAWGTSKLSKTDNNLFGIKFPGNHGVQISMGSHATDDGGNYAHYNSWSDSVEDHGYFLKNNSRYTEHGAFSAKTPEEQITAIKAAGYATASNYVSAIMGTINANELTQYDTGTYTGDAGASEGITVEATNYEVVKGSEKEGDSLYGRRYRITVSDENNDGVDVSKLRCTFNIVKTIQMEPNISIIEIYNLNVKTENAIITSGKRVTVEAGYEGTQFGLIFDGDIIQCINSRDDGTTCKLTIVALDSDRAINFALSNFSIMKGQTQRDIVDHMTNLADNPIDIGSISDKLKGQALPRGKVIFGKESDYFRQIAKSNGMHFYMDNGALNIISMEDMPEGEIFDLSPKSGLIGTPEQSDYGISGKCLINPQIKINTLIHVDNKLVRAKQIDISGSNASPTGGVATGDTRNKIISEAKRICDDPNVQYSQPNRGQTVGGVSYWDCSSFVKHCYEVAGLSIVDITGPQYNEVASNGKFIEESEASPGDIVFWGEGSSCHHVAIYAGDGHIYAARGRNGIAPNDQVEYQAIYGTYKIGRPKCLIDADGGNAPSCTNTNEDDDTSSQGLFRALDKDGIYRVIKITYQGDTRGNDWYLNFETIDQLGGVIPGVSS